MAKVKDLKKENRNLVQKTLRLQERIRQEIKKKGVQLESKESDFFTSIVTLEANSPFEIRSPQHLLREEQKKQASLKDAHSKPLYCVYGFVVYLHYNVVGDLSGKLCHDTSLLSSVLKFGTDIHQTLLL